MRDTGTNLLELRQGAAEFGLNTRVIKATPETLASCPLPAIGHWEEQVGVSGHYVVIVSTKEDWVEYIDGTTAIRDYLPMNEFKTRWTGHLLVVQDSALWWRWLYVSASLLALIPLGTALWWQWRGNRPPTPVPSPTLPAPTSPGDVA